MGLQETLTILAILIGPIAAVIVTRVMDNRREDYRRRLDVFRMLMRYRRHRLAGDFVGSLNLVPVEFDRDKDVLAAHKVIMDTVYDPTWKSGDEEALKVLIGQLDDRSTALLDKIAQNLGIRISQLDILRGAYAPQAWEDQESLMKGTQRMIFELLLGNRSIRVVTESAESVTSSPKTAAEQGVVSLAEMLIEQMPADVSRPSGDKGDS